MDTLLIAADSDAKQVPNMELAQLVFSYSHFLQTDPAKAEEFKIQILDAVSKGAMAPFYKDITAQNSWNFDQALYDSMK